MKYGQVVAVRNWNTAMWRCRIFVAAQEYKKDTIFLCKLPGEDDDAVTVWTECVPLWDVEPKAFLERK